MSARDRYAELRSRRPRGYGPATTKQRDDHCIVVCGVCQHESIGDFFGAVWAEPRNLKDAWEQHRRHVDAKHPTEAEVLNEIVDLVRERRARFAAERPGDHPRNEEERRLDDLIARLDEIRSAA